MLSIRIDEENYRWRTGLHEHVRVGEERSTFNAVKESKLLWSALKFSRDIIIVLYGREGANLQAF